MGTKSQWRADKLAFYNAPMFQSVGSMNSNVVAVGTSCMIETVIVSAPDYVGNFTTNHNQQFRAVVGGVISAATANCALTLRRGTVDVLALTLNVADASITSTNVPWGAEFQGRFSGVDSSGHIAATGKAWAAWQGGTTEVYGGTTGGTTNMFASTAHDFTTNSATGLNVTLEFSTSPGSHITATHGYIEFFEG